jgi:hypothetical protein
LRALPIAAICLISFLIGLAALFLPRQSEGSTAGTPVPADRALAQPAANPTPTVAPHSAQPPTQESVPVVASAPSPPMPGPAAGSTPIPSASAQASATPTPPAPADIVARITAAEAALRSGEFDATIEYAGGSRSVVRVRFDFGSGQEPRRLHIASTSQSATGSATFEQIAIGEQAWQRQADGSWALAPTQDGMWDQIQAYLPNSRAIANATLALEGKEATLSYRIAAGRAEAVLIADPTTGTPLRLRQQSADDGTTITVVYRGWNVPTSIEAPQPR